MILKLLILLLNFNKINSQFGGLQCCANCLKETHIIGGNDALDFEKCTRNNTGCCYENNCHMSLITNNFIFDNEIEYNNNIPYIKQGNWVQLQWENIEYITYIFIDNNQTKEIQPKNNSIVLEPTNDNWFQLCVENIGNIYFRGWDNNGCIASKEYNILITEDKNFDKDNSICINTPKLDIVDNCNLNRASLIDDVCVCISGYSNPPNCDKTSKWTTIVIIICVTVTFISIIWISYKCYMKYKKINPPINNFYLDDRDSITGPNSRYRRNIL